MLDDATIRAWRDAYNLDRLTPEAAARWWYVHQDGLAPAGAVAALGHCLLEIERLRGLLGRQRQPLTDEQIDKACEGIWGSDYGCTLNAAMQRAIARAIEEAHGIGAGATEGEA